MASVFIVLIVFGSIIMMMAIIASASIMGLKITRSGGKQKDRKSDNEEARTVEEMYQGLSRMEERVESLETIILDRERERKGKAK